MKIAMEIVDVPKIPRKNISPMVIVHSYVRKNQRVFGKWRGCEILHYLRSVVYPIILDRFQPSFSWCKIGSVMENPWGFALRARFGRFIPDFRWKLTTPILGEAAHGATNKKRGMTLPGLAE